MSQSRSSVAIWEPVFFFVAPVVDDDDLDEDEGRAIIAPDDSSPSSSSSFSKLKWIGSILWIDFCYYARGIIAFIPSEGAVCLVQASFSYDFTSLWYIPEEGVEQARKHAARPLPLRGRQPEKALTDPEK